MRGGKRIAMVAAVFVISVMLFSFYLIYQSGIIKGLSPEIDEKVEEAEKRLGGRYFYDEGIICDRNGDPITQKVDRDKDGEIDKYTEVIYPTVYNIIGYASNTYSLSGIRLALSDMDCLFTEKGAVINLTTDNALQQYVYEVLGNRKGCIVVLDNTNGEILALVNRPDKKIEFNVNEIDEKYNTYVTIPEFFYNRALLPDAPGSVFKAVTAISMVENGLADHKTENMDNYRGIPNAEYVNATEVDMELALEKSLNTYFASAAVEYLGGRKLLNTAHKFSIGMDPIKLDVGTLYSNCDMGHFDDAGLIADCAYGQGRTLIAPLHIAMVFGTISNNNNKLLMPHIVKEIRNGDVAEYTVPENDTVKTDLDKNVVDTVKGHLHATATSYDYGFDEETYGYDMIAKTGTAENEKPGTHIYLATANSRFTVVISSEETDEMSHDLAPLAKEIYGYLERNGF